MSVAIATPSATRDKAVLTHRGVEALRPDAAAYRVPDLRCPGLALRVAPSGLKTWDVAFRTRIALGSKKAKGESLGNLRNLGDAGVLGRTTQRTDAEKFAANLIPVIRSIQAAGTTGMVAIAKALNERYVRTPRGGLWHCSSVRNVLRRSAIL